jgi:hypothetical protein
MTRRLAVLALLAASWCATSTAALAALGQDGRDGRRIEAIRDALMRLPYYGVFDFLNFSYDRGTVVLGGYAYRATLPQDAERAVKLVPGVDAVKVDITTLPLSMFDDDIRWRVFYAIYTNSFLARYAPGGGLWGHTHPLGPLGPFAGFPGAQPVGNYPIHIVVQGGRVRLLGVVDSDADRTAATLAARGVSGTFAVENELVVDAR